MSGTGDIPATVIGGYLGAGKTTLVNHLLRHRGERRLAVLVNEFGALPIDADLIERRDQDLIAIAGGCVCCSYGSDLIAALERLRDLSLPPDHVLIEASGVALPAGIAAALGLVSRYVHAATIAVADAETVRERAADRYMADTIARQLAEADLVVMNKTDLVASQGLAATEAYLTGAAPAAAIVRALNSAIPGDLAFGPTIRPPAQATAPSHGAEGYETFAVELDGEVAPERLGEALCALAPGLLRAKGFAVRRDGKMVAVQTVGRRWSVAPASVEGVGRLVAIALAGTVGRRDLIAAIRSAQD